MARCACRLAVGTVHAVQESPERLKDPTSAGLGPLPCAVGRRRGLEDLAGRLGMPEVRFPMHGEELEGSGLRHAVVLRQGLNLGSDDLGDVRLVSVQGGQALGERRFGGERPESAMQPQSLGQRRGGLDPGPRKTQGVGEAKPQLGVMLLAPFLVHEVAKELLARWKRRASGMERADVGREPQDVVVVPRRVARERLEAQLSRRPGAVERMAQRRQARDRLLDLLEKLGHRGSPVDADRSGRRSRTFAVKSSIVVHQVHELWFRVLLHELRTIVGDLRSGDVGSATALVRRATEIVRVLVHQVEVLQTMTPMHFLEFRDRLKPASGLQSAQYREVEYLSGLRDPRYLELVEGEEIERLRQAMREPTLWEAFCDLLRARGFALSGANGEVEAVVRIDSDPQHAELRTLTEAMLDYDESFCTWRGRHALMAERMIGRKPGTGDADTGRLRGRASFGEPGVQYLWPRVGLRFFPALWEARTGLRVPTGQAAGHAR